jgi:SAM-dependent methyltransferase
MSSFDRFLNPYQTVRRAEGWGAPTAAYYRSLPLVPPTDPQREIWRVRAASFRALLRTISTPRRVLDVGAGNGWLTYQLARRGHVVAAVDVNDDPLDGLGAFGNYPLALKAYRADFSALPFGSAQFDCVIFNASLHYARDLSSTVAEALRVLAPAGMIVVMDSPLYRHAASGRAMFVDKTRGIKDHLGVEIGNDVIGFLTFADFENLSCAFALNWRWTEPLVDVRWATRHWRARLRDEREPARFGLMMGTRG